MYLWMFASIVAALLIYPVRRRRLWSRWLLPALCAEGAAMALATGLIPMSIGQQIHFALGVASLIGAIMAFIYLWLAERQADRDFEEMLDLMKPFPLDPPLLKPRSDQRETRRR
ncbi:hypothetical protein [Geopseudomonas aromaticivorans]